MDDKVRVKIEVTIRTNEWSHNTLAADDLEMTGYLEVLDTVYWEQIVANLVNAVIAKAKANSPTEIQPDSN